MLQEGQSSNWTHTQNTRYFHCQLSLLKHIRYGACSAAAALPPLPGPSYCGGLSEHAFVGAPSSSLVLAVCEFELLRALRMLDIGASTTNLHLLSPELKTTICTKAAEVWLHLLQSHFPLETITAQQTVPELPG